jgi:hypothetical protein
MENQLQKVQQLVARLTVSMLGKPMRILVKEDIKVSGGRVFIQIAYIAPCSQSGELLKLKGRKWYLSDHMLDDEIVKTAYAAFKAAMEHEIMEGFKCDFKVVFNPHVSFEDLIKINREVKREEKEVINGNS